MNQYNQRIKIIVIGALALTNILSFSAFKSTEHSFIEQSKLIEEYQTRTELQRSQIEELTEQLNTKEESKEVTTRDILLTAYHTGDGSSGITTASGLSTNDFQTNDKGWYTYDGKIVMATPNLERINLPLVSGYKAYKDNDLIEFEYEGSIYQGIVLDVCGACYGVVGETEQRYDIFTNGTGIGKKKGILYE